MALEIVAGPGCDDVKMPYVEARRRPGDVVISAGAIFKAITVSDAIPSSNSAALPAGVVPADDGDPASARAAVGRLCPDVERRARGPRPAGPRHGRAGRDRAHDGPRRKRARVSPNSCPRANGARRATKGSSGGGSAGFSRPRPTARLHHERRNQMARLSAERMTRGRGLGAWSGR